MEEKKEEEEGKRKGKRKKEDEPASTTTNDAPPPPPAPVHLVPNPIPQYSKVLSARKPVTYQSLYVIFTTDLGYLDLFCSIILLLFLLFIGLLRLFCMF